MKRYAAFLRGVNISGKNKLSMSELKQSLKQLAFSEVRTYLNSGNVIFSSEETDTLTLAEEIEALIARQFGLEIPVFVITLEALKDILNHAPDWWGTDNKEIYDNLIFILPPATFSEVYAEIGEPNQELEQIREYQGAVFWSFSRKDYQKTNWWSETAKADISRRLTIRTANTVRKAAGM